jgi:hypothetical protein
MAVWYGSVSGCRVSVPDFQVAHAVPVGWNALTTPTPTNLLRGQEAASHNAGFTAGIQLASAADANWPDHASPEKPAAAPLADTHSLDLARGLLDRRREVFANWHTRRVPIASAVTVGGGLACRALSAASQPGWANWHPRRVPLGDARPVMPPTRSQTPPIPKTFSDCSPPIVGITPREPGRSSSV